MTEQELDAMAQHFEYSEGEAWKDGPRLIAEVRRLQTEQDRARAMWMAYKASWARLRATIQAAEPVRWPQS